MTQVWTEDGKVIPVTVLEVPACKVAGLKTSSKHGYNAVLLQLGKVKKEFRVNSKKYQLGKEVLVSDFKPGEIINIAGISKGRGFTGPVKRHGFHGAPASHGHDHPRAVGAIGQRFPQHVRPGLRMAGRMGGKNATVRHSQIIGVDSKNRLLYVKGGVPGGARTILKVMTSGQAKAIPKIIEYGKGAK